MISSKRKCMDTTDGSAAEKVTNDINWQATRSTVRERSEPLFANEYMADVHFIMGKSDVKNTKKRIPAHKFILATGSSIFHAMFYGTLREEGDEITIEDIGESAFLVFLRYLYSDDTKLNADSVLETLYAAKKYLVPSLIKACTNFLITNLDVNNVCLVLTSLIVSDEPKVVQRCWDVIDSETELALKADGFNDIDIKTLENILTRETLSCKEICIFKAALKWAAAECDRQDLAPTPANLRAVIGDLLYLIRIPTMSVEEFADDVVLACILSAEEISKILLHITSNNRAYTLDYPITKRVGWTSRNKVCSRFNGSVTTVNGSSCCWKESLGFTVDKEIFLVGFGIYGPHNLGDYDVTIKLKCKGEILADNVTKIYSGGNCSICKVYFQYPIEIQPNSLYNPSLCFNNKAINSGVLCSGTLGMEKLTVEGITFQFSYCGVGDKSFSTVSKGQFPELIYFI